MLLDNIEAKNYKRLDPGANPTASGYNASVVKNLQRN
jgi:hypothetical protein